MKYTATLFLSCLLMGCRTLSPVERDLLAKVPFAVNQVLLRDVISTLNEDTATELRMEPRLCEVADLCITYLPKRAAEALIPLGVALDILRWQTVLQYHVPMDWRMEGDHILVFFAGTDEEYDALKKRDLPNMPVERDN